MERERERGGGEREGGRERGHSAQATHLSSTPMGALNLPSSQQELEEADSYLREWLIPPVLLACK